jgi:molybdate transport system regulatory protein
LNAAVPDSASAPVRVSVRLELESGGRVGPGKIALLEAIAREGSIAGAARALGMSYPRAWALVEAVDAALGAPAVSRAPGGHRGGGAELTAAGRALIARYRDVEAAAQRQAGPEPTPKERAPRSRRGG